MFEGYVDPNGATQAYARAAKTRRANLGHGYRETDIFLGFDLTPEQLAPFVVSHRVIEN